MNLSTLLPLLIHDFKSEADLLKAIEEVSIKFTRERHKMGDYLKDPRLVSAYTAFYLLTNIPKLHEVFKWMPATWLEELKACDLIDLGSGPGTFSLAWKQLDGFKGSVYQIELSNLMKEQGRKIWEAIYSEKLYQGGKWEWVTDKPKCLLFGHSANEMGAETALKYIEKINPEHILFIEPGTKDFFPVMLEIREALIQQQYAVLFPCPGQLACPMKNSQADWCHQFIQIKQEPEIERISQMLRKDRKLLPLTVHAYSRTFQESNPAERIIRVLPETKFSLEWEVCHNNQLKHYQVMQRDLTKKDAKELSALRAGTAIETELVRTLEHANRVKVLKIK